MAYTPDSIRRLMLKHEFSAKDIRYILRESNTTLIHLLDGHILSTLIPLGHFEDYLPEEEFLRINKNVLLCTAQVVNVDRGRYLMTDGAVLEGRRRGGQIHKNFMLHMISQQVHNNETGMLRSLQEKFSVYDDLPLPFCVMQMVYDLNGAGTSFVFRYCNKMMEQLEGRPLGDLINHSFFDIFENADSKWMVTYGDIAKNGGRKIIHKYSSEIQKDIIVCCYQITPGFCACLVMESSWLARLQKTAIEF